ncbi:phosphatidate cytidylyltransferase [Mucilaginibacter myungsuensis]|uniref:Phosphatidate cytidylyltransferase n=1 Tax=Mucilaginibacter myungsuensis TaxID=649104 RepID=A0A929L1L9_9SPHI|nr:phosphatidate cytidylyltransferase [Mucilaginibacter myungsuensis]MBE9661591.1 phosphatidate cytidylyltransferase [Mucilaginibacter myungsuensis]MDN3597736.1 phosphatidate cytidylyltransferase [Mucilaginibacter myungsuensis]
MKTRAITGLFFLIVMLASLLTGHYPFGAFYLLLALFCQYEFYGLIKKAGYFPNIYTGMFNGAFIYTVFALLAFHRTSPAAMFLIPVPLSFIFILELYKKTSTPFQNIAFTFLGLVFTIMPFTFFHAMAYMGTEFNFHIPLGFFVMLWSNDTGAYLTGRAFGRMKLFERHSPKKTVEGFVGGVLISGLAGYILSIYYPELHWSQWITMAVLISCFGTLGDLVESMFKRSINVKDSGGILPGHGGVLDRFDGLLIAAPIVYSYLYFVTN